MSCNFRPPQLRNDYKLPKIYYQMIPLWYVLFSFLPLESIKKHSPGMYAPYKKLTQIFGNVRCPILANQVRRCAAWLTNMEVKQT